MTVTDDISHIRPSDREIRCELGPVRQPIQILSTDNEHKFTLNEQDLSKLLLREDIKDLKVVVVSVAGAFRKGKSFLLDFFLRYMRANGTKNWLGDDDTPLQGFSWKGGCERDTTGILIWNEVFKVRAPSGDELAVLFMDTQGSFDSHSTVKDCATIFALSTMTSSIQVYNLSQNIQEDDLQHLQLFTEYGRLASEADAHGASPFQKLLFLVRDWSYPYDAPYGHEGGKKILERRLEISEKQHPELQQLRKHIRSCFSSITCFLLPHPGLKVATSPNFDGRNRDIESDFKTHLGELVPSLLAPQNLVKKEINGKDVSCQELLEYFRAYVNVFGGNELPEPKTMLEATAEANNLAAVAVSRDFYTRSMEKLCGGDQPYISPRELQQHHSHFKNQARSRFEHTRKMGGDEFCERYLHKLMNELDQMYINFQKHNESKNIFQAARTPACLFSVVIFFYISSGVFALFGLYPLANVCNLIMGLVLLALVTWIYVQYSGEMREIGHQIDLVAVQLWMRVLKPLYKVATQDRLAVGLSGEDSNSQVSSPPTLDETPTTPKTQAENSKKKVD
ncbi:atlastin-2-like [Tropilaelaps mercedesae]|uniref:Atlastin-2-like n=1 Tax=Tropilaelaps mercedesae TaxID=418985 RepID=A0A1V9X9A0_9ACAR|nr:atlastin-2-like [Tropilaelaps mercedesae]